MIKLSVHEGCKAIGGADMYQPRTKKCIACKSTDVKKFRPTEENIEKLKDAIKRFPRTLKIAPELQAAVDMITQRTKDFGCPGQVISVNAGPVVTEFEFKPAQYTRVRKIKTLGEDLAVAMGAESVTVVPAPTKSAMSICVSNKIRSKILFNETTLKQVIAHRDDMLLPICFGVTAIGEPFVEDLTQLPHLLIAGSTGAGKSVFMHNIVDGLAYIRTPKQVQFAFIDPKQVELFSYKNIPHLWMGEKPVDDVWGAFHLMDRLIEEMKRRNGNMHSVNVKDIHEYNARIQKEADTLRAIDEEAALKREADKWPYIILMIDEMADLIMTEKKEFIDRIARISAMARASGIHVVAATQRPSVDVLANKVKVNFPARVAFRVPSQADSKTILGLKGAESLLGKGDMLYMSPLKPEKQRIHAPLVTKEETETLLKMSIEFGHQRMVPADHLTVAPAVIEKSNGKATKKAMVN